MNSHPSRLPGQSSDWLGDDWYRLRCELLVLYGLIPLGDAGIVIIGERGSVVRGTGSAGK